MRRSPLLAAGLGLLLACRLTPPPKPPEPPPAPQSLAPWSWYAVGGILVVEGEVDRATDLFLQGRTWRESRACEAGPVRWELYKPPDDEPAELRDGSGRLLARWDFRKPWQPEPSLKPAVKPQPAPAKPKPLPVPPPPAKAVEARPEPPRPLPPAVVRPVVPPPPAPKPAPPSRGLWERFKGWFGGGSSPQAPKPAPKPVPAPKPAPTPVPKPPAPSLPKAEPPKPLPPPVEPKPVRPAVPQVPKSEPPKALPPAPRPTPPTKGFWERLRGWFGGGSSPSTPKPPAPRVEPPKPPAPKADPLPAPKTEPPKPPVSRPAVPAPPPPALPKPEPSKPRTEPTPVPRPAVPAPPSPAPPKPAPPKPEPPKAVPVKPAAPRVVPPSQGSIPLWAGAGDGFNLLRGAPGQKRICLTFDGGSAAEVAQEVLDALRKHRVRTTFFLTGAFIQNFPDLVKRIVADGHEVGNHTQNHPHLAPNYRRDPAWTRERFQEELLAADRAFQALIGRPMDPLWRAPFGEHTLEIRKWAEELGYRHVGWSEGADTLDWATVHERKLYRTGEKILERLDQRTARSDGDGLIVLMHLGSGRPEEDRPSRSLGRFIEAKRKAGWSFVPVSHYLKDSGRVVWDSAARAALLARGAAGPS